MLASMLRQAACVNYLPFLFLASEMTTPDSHISPELLALIAARLRPVCPDIPELEFERLVRDVARVTTKYDRDKFAAPPSGTALPNDAPPGLA
jgi:hypothetical protein